MKESTRHEVRAGMVQGITIAVLVGVLAAPIVGWYRAPSRATHAPVPPAPTMALPEVDFGSAEAPPDVRTIAAWAVGSGDAGRAAFALVDKRRTHLYVFDAQGRLRGHTPVLLGYAPGDDSVPGIGQRPIEQVRPAERTTPAGRFDVASGRNLLGEEVIWVDYQHAVSMHRVRATDPRERRLERLTSATTDDNRISYGCINVPAAFFEQVVWPLFGGQRAVVYVLPEVKPLDAVFPQAADWQRARLPTRPVPLA